MGDMDSALLCFQKLYKANTLEAREMSCKYMARIYREKGQTDKSLEYMVEYEACDDSMQERSAISKAKAKLQVKFLGRSCEPGEFDAFLRSL